MGEPRRGSEHGGTGAVPGPGVPAAEGFAGLEPGASRGVSRAGARGSSGSEPASDRAVTGAQGLGALSPGMEDPEYGGPGGVIGVSLGVGGSRHGGSAHGVHGGPPGLGSLGTWSYWGVTREGGPGTWGYQVCPHSRGTATPPGLQGHGWGGGGGVTGTRGAPGLEVPGAFLGLEEGSDGILSSTLGLGGVTRAGETGVRR